MNRDVAIAIGLALVTFVVLMATQGIGVPRDESFYYHAAVEYVGWFDEMWEHLQRGSLDGLRQVSVDRHMSYNAEHPALMKLMFGVSWQLFSQKLGWLSEIDALRVPAVAMASILASLVYLFARPLYGGAAGVFAVALLFLQPRFFWHAHLACFDVPVVACWVAVVYCYWRWLEDSRWGVLTGIAWGIALSVKLNAFFLPAVLGLHWLIIAARERRAGKPFAFPWVFFWMAVIGPVMFLVLWPRHWFDTVDRIQWYLNFHLRHVHYFVYYFGQNLQQPPLPVSYPWVMTLLTVPATILASFVAGVALWARSSPTRGRDRLTGVLFGLNVIFPIALISLPSTPIFGGTKHWATAMPFLAIVAAGAVVTCGVAVGRALKDRPQLGVALVGFAVMGPAFSASVENHPMGPAYYNELAGSYRGAADLRMMRKFWGFAAREGLWWVNEHAPPNAHVWTHNTTHWAFEMYQKDGLARQDLRPTGHAGSQIALYHHQKAFIHVLIPLWQSYGIRTPSYVVHRDGVPYLSVYVRPPPKR